MEVGVEVDDVVVVRVEAAIVALLPNGGVTVVRGEDTKAGMVLDVVILAEVCEVATVAGVVLVNDNIREVVVGATVEDLGVVNSIDIVDSRF